MSLLLRPREKSRLYIVDDRRSRKKEEKERKSIHQSTHRATTLRIRRTVRSSRSYARSMDNYVTGIKCRAVIWSTELCFWNGATAAHSIRDQTTVNLTINARNRAVVATSRCLLWANRIDIAIHINVRFAIHSVKFIIFLNPRLINGISHALHMTNSLECLFNLCITCLAFQTVTIG